MPVDIKAIKSLLGDRILIRPLARSEKRGSLFVPQSALKDKAKQTDVWWGEIESLGRDARYPDAYGLKPGDIVAVEFLGRQCETLTDDNGDEHCWVAEEFIAAKDDGRYVAFRDNNPFDGNFTGITPVGQYCLVSPDPEQDKRGGIHIPDSAREQQKTGDCLAVSSGDIIGSELVPLHVEAKTRVLFGRYSGSWAKLDKEFLLMKQENVIAVLDEAKVTANV